MQEDVASGSTGISFYNGKSYRYEYPDFVIRVKKRNGLPVPANTFLVDEDGTQHNDFMGSFFIAWVGNHAITQGGQVIFATTNRKQVSVHSTYQHWEVRGPAGELLKRDGHKLTAIVARHPLSEPLLSEHSQYVLDNYQFYTGDADRAERKRRK
ncbi:hypothetical protein HDU86_008450 [Geranomyces michiganensis]|nr:hypothetical protein HDU86_008450 [Geranomyces michiganensis]